ncbi:MAG: hypothetical protein OQJ97_11425 [Rhodospirillales bacterium]|nr:hypothetical protein [Rhodospirillales bacterium]
MGIGVLFHDLGKDEHLVDHDRIKDAMKTLTAKLEKKADKLRQKLENEDLSPKTHRHLTTKLHVIEAQIEHGQKSGLIH